MLAASIERSRQRWLADGVFERYWAKPTKKKALGDAPNPAKETMSKLGSCSMIIEPHVFEVTLYTVKDLPMSFPGSNTQPPPLSAPQYNPFSHTAAFNPPVYNPQSAVPHHPYQDRQRSNSSQLSLPPFKEGFAQLGPRGPPPIYHAPLSATAPAGSFDTPNRPRTDSDSGEATQDKETGSKADPVIQMLATRAASDHGLKSLMKVVASGKASPEQLKTFQSHIDELNEILKSPRSQTLPFPNGTHPSSSHHGGQDYTSPSLFPNPTPYNHNNRRYPGLTCTALDPGTAQVKTEPIPQTYHPMIPPANTKLLNAHKPDINAIVFDFGGTGDRFSFPRFSILEYLYGGTQVIVSFLVIRRGNLAVSESYRDTKSYYQPITIRLSTPQPKILEPLTRIVASPDEVRNYMNSVFDKMNRAHSIFLATRLPRAPCGEEVDYRESSDQPRVHLIKDVYSPPNSIVPLAV